MLLVVITVLTAFAVGAILGHRAGRTDGIHFLVGISNPQERWIYTIRHVLGLERFNGVYGQDLWLLHSMFPDGRRGFFVDVGSADGEVFSNTSRLEGAGWSGICIDPFPRNMRNRRCQVFEEVVDSEAGRTVRFQSPGTYSGGILDYAGWWVSEEEKQKPVELKTTTLRAILQRANAPKFIEYVNVDIEGAEYEALRAFPFDEYKIGALTVEHNNLEDRRLALRELLEAQGYRLEWAIRDQDWYVPRTASGISGHQPDSRK